MADVSDAEQALVDAITAVCASMIPLPEVYRGWPSASDLSAAERGSRAIVSVFQRSGFARNTSRYPVEEIALPPVPVALTVTLTGVTAAFAGTCSPDQIAGVQIGSTAWAVRCGVGDTPATIAASLAARCGGTAFGSAVTRPGLIAARTARDGVTLRPTRQQEVGIMVTVWCSDPIQRDVVAGAVDAALSDQPFLFLADGSAARLRWVGTISTDRAENANTYRRDLFVSVDYATTIRRVRPAVLFEGSLINSAPAGALAPPGL